MKLIYHISIIISVFLFNLSFVHAKLTCSNLFVNNENSFQLEPSVLSYVISKNRKNLTNYNFNFVLESIKNYQSINPDSFNKISTDKDETELIRDIADIIFDNYFSKKYFNWNKIGRNEIDSNDHFQNINQNKIEFNYIISSYRYLFSNLFINEFTAGEFQSNHSKFQKKIWYMKLNISSDIGELKSFNRPDLYYSLLEHNLLQNNTEINFRLFLDWISIAMNEDIGEFGLNFNVMDPERKNNIQLQSYKKWMTKLK